MSLSSSCRTRLKQVSSESVPISTKLYDFLEQDLHLQRVPRIHPQLELPQNVCFDCYRNIIALKTFYLRCRAAQEFFLMKIDREMLLQESKLTAVKYNRQLDKGSAILDISQLAFVTISPNDIEFLQEEGEEVIFVREEECGESNILEVTQDDTSFTMHAASVQDNGTEKESDLIMYAEPNESPETENLICTTGNAQETIEYFSDNEEFNKKRRRRFHCQLCDKTFTSRYDLNMHENIHSGIKPFSCNVCGKSFRQKNVLRTHEALHFGKNVKCEECGKSFARKSQLIIHDRMHKNIKPFKCDYENCTAAFRERQHLLGHQKIHVGVRDHQCQICSSAFFNRKSLLSHTRDVHSNIFYQCDRCPHKYNKPYKIRKHMQSVHKVQLANVSQLKCTVLDSLKDEDEADYVLISY